MFLSYMVVIIQPFIIGFDFMKNTVKRLYYQEKITCTAYPFRLKVLEAIDKDSLSFSQACLAFNIPPNLIILFN